ncbi:MAG TPA: CBS domain-containing protein [bacterium]|nr:CBS domain-containing protein [bacterium]
MNARVRDVMTPQVMAVTPHQTVGHVRDLMARKRIQALPVTGPEDEVLGIVTAVDLLRAHKDATPVASIMTKEVLTIPDYADVSKAARMMRNRRIHHLVVTGDGKMLGILSSYDLLKLVEDHRFVPKNAPSTPGRPRGKSGSHRRRSG